MAGTGSGTLTADTVTTVTLSGKEFSFEEIVGVEVINRTGSDEIWFTLGPDAPDPTVEGAGCLCVPASICSYIASARWSEITDGGSKTTGIVVKLISAGTPKFTVTGV